MLQLIRLYPNSFTELIETGIQDYFLETDKQVSTVIDTPDIRIHHESSFKTRSIESIPHRNFISIYIRTMFINIVNCPETLYTSIANPEEWGSTSVPDNTVRGYSIFPFQLSINNDIRDNTTTFTFDIYLPEQDPCLIQMI